MRCNVQNTHLVPIVIACIFLMGAPLSHALSLSQALARAESITPELKSAHLGIEIAEQEYQRTLAAAYPSLSLSSTLNNNRTLGSQGVSYANNSQTIALSQPLWNQAVNHATEISLLNKHSQEELYTQTLYDTRIKVIRAYFDWMIAMNNAISIKAQKEAVAEQLAVAERSFEVGTATITDTHEARAQYSSILAQEIVIQNDIQIKRQLLQQWVGGNLDNQTATLEVDTLNLLGGTMEEWHNKVDAQNISLMNLRTLETISQQQIKLKNTEKSFTINLSASLSRFDGRSQPSSVSSQTNSAALGISFNYPIDISGLTKASVKAAIAQSEQVSIRIEILRRQLFQSVEQLYLGLNSVTAQLKAYKESEKSNELAVASNKLAYEVGLRVNADLLNAQARLYQVRRDIFNLRANYLSQYAELLSLAAELDTKALAQIEKFILVQ